MAATFADALTQGEAYELIREGRQRDRAATNAAIVVAGDLEPESEHGSSQEVVQAMTETPASGNFGRRASTLNYRESDQHDGLQAPVEHRFLSSEKWEAVNFLRGGGATIVHRTELHLHGARGYAPGEWQRLLSPTESEDLDRAAVRAQVLEELGFTEDELSLLDKSGRPSPEIKALRARFDERLLQVVEANGGTDRPGKNGSGTTHLATALGWPIDTARTGHCSRLSRSLKRARAARASPEAHPQPAE